MTSSSCRCHPYNQQRPRTGLCSPTAKQTTARRFIKTVGTEWKKKAGRKVTYKSSTGRAQLQAQNLSLEHGSCPISSTSRPSYCTHCWRGNSYVLLNYFHKRTYTTAMKYRTSTRKISLTTFPTSQHLFVRTQPAFADNCWRDWLKTGFWHQTKN